MKAMFSKTSDKKYRDKDYPWGPGDRKGNWPDYFNHPQPVGYHEHGPYCGCDDCRSTTW